MKIQYNQALDLCCAVLQYVNWSRTTELKNSGYRISPELEQWQKNISAGIPRFLESDIKMIAGDFIGLLFLPAEIALRENISSPAEMISALRALPDETLPELLFKSYATGKSYKTVKNQPEKIKKAIKAAGGTTRENEAELFLELCVNPGLFKLRVADMLEQFYQLALRPHEGEVEQELSELLAEAQRVLDEDQHRFFSDYCRINRNSNDPLPRIFISWYAEIDIIQLEEPPVVIFGKSRKYFKAGEGLEPEQIYALLSDESRRKILKMLCRKPWFIRELAEEIGLTSATVSYHMSRLSELDLVRYEQGERKRVYYTADKAAVEKIFRTVKSDIMG